MKRPSAEELAGVRKRPVDMTHDDLRAALAGEGGNQTHAAKAFGMSLNTLKAKMRRFWIKKSDFER